MGITLNPSLICDNSTLANFKAWAGNSTGIASFLQTAGSGLSQTADTGQVNWSSIASVPTVGNYVYEIYKNTDALTNFYFKIEYGTGAASSNTNPRIRISIGTGTNGAGVLTGIIAGPMVVQIQDPSVPSTSITYACWMSAAPGRLSILMWQGNTVNTGATCMFGLERSCDTSGNYNSAFVTLMSAGNNGTSSGTGYQQSIVFSASATPLVTSGMFLVSMLANANFSTFNTTNFNGKIGLSPMFPWVGDFDNPHRIVMLGMAGDFTEGASYTIASGNMPYGISKTYIATKTSRATGQLVPNTNGNNVYSALLVEYD